VVLEMPSVLDPRRPRRLKKPMARAQSDLDKEDVHIAKQPVAKGHHAARTAKGAAARHAGAAKPAQDTSSAEVEGLTPAEVLVKYRELKAENDRLRQELTKKQDSYIRRADGLRSENERWRSMLEVRLGWVGRRTATTRAKPGRSASDRCFQTDCGVRLAGGSATARRWIFYGKSDRDTHKPSGTRPHPFVGSECTGDVRARARASAVRVHLGSE
jgi:hypothetical protein